ncbi:uncharacterized protein [Watersipora subatra]|uniref:uncharacterized protein n=1 Tax=Watersipora subatra TaxID=2589382 RepID=UPI00355B4B23
MASFYHTIAEPDDLVKCPYDPVHMVRMKKLQYHLMKCRKNFPNRQMSSCPFNAGHIVPEAELRFHMNSCPDKHAMTLLHQEHEVEGWTKGNTDVPTYFPDVGIPESTEDWDAEVSVPRIGVQARDVAGIGYHKPLVGLQRAQKKAYYDNLRRGDEEANVKLFEDMNMVDNDEQDDSGLIGNKSTAVDVEHRPATAPVTFAQPMKGRGRGIRAGGRATATPGVTQQPTESLDDIKRLLKKTNKKLRQIEQLLTRQAAGETLNEEEKIKVAHKATFEFKCKTILAQIEAAEKQAGGDTT